MNYANPVVLTIELSINAIAVKILKYWMNFQKSKVIETHVHARLLNLVYFSMKIQWGHEWIWVMVITTTILERVIERPMYIGILLILWYGISMVNSHAYSNKVTNNSKSKWQMIGLLNFWSIAGKVIIGTIIHYTVNTYWYKWTHIAPKMSP